MCADVNLQDDDEEEDLELLEEVLNLLPGPCGTAEKNAAMLICLARFEERYLTYSKGLSIRILQTKNKKQSRFHNATSAALPYPSFGHHRASNDICTLSLEPPDLPF